MLNRFNGNVIPFANGADPSKRYVFGGNTASDDINNNINADFNLGWEIVGVNAAPPKQWFNALGYTSTYLSAYLYQMGIPQYNDSQEYFLYSRAMGSDGNIYKSKTGTEGSPNVGNDPVADGGVNWENESANFVSKTGNETIAGVKTFSSNPLSTASQSTNVNALTKWGSVVKNSGNETIAGVKTFSLSPIIPTPTTSTQAANKSYVDANAGETITAGTGLQKSGTTLNFYPYGLSTATTELTTSDFLVVSDSTTPKKITISNFANELPLLGVGQTWQDVTASRAFGVTYTNSTGKPIYIAINGMIGANAVKDISINGVNVAFGANYSNGAWHGHTIIPNGATYNLSTFGTIIKWSELR